MNIEVDLGSLSPSLQLFARTESTTASNSTESAAFGRRRVSLPLSRQRARLCRCSPRMPKIWTASVYNHTMNIEWFFQSTYLYQYIHMHVQIYVLCTCDYICIFFRVCGCVWVYVGLHAEMHTACCACLNIVINDCVWLAGLGDCVCCCIQSYGYQLWLHVYMMRAYDCALDSLCVCVCKS